MQLFERSANKPQIHLTPLIDILFLIIIFFVVSSKIVDDIGVGLELPESQQSQSTSGEAPILIMDAQGNYSLNGQNITFSELPEALNTLKTTDRHTTLILHADKSVAHGDVIQTMDVIKFHGFEKLVFGTQPSQITE